MKKHRVDYLDRDIKDMETAMIVAGIGLPFALFLGIKLIDCGWYIIGLPLLLVSAVCAFSFFATVVQYMEERALIAFFKQQTKDLFIGSLGEAETWEDDETVSRRVAFAITMLKRSQNPHGITIYAALFRDACVFVYALDEEADVISATKIMREGLTVRETREQYAVWWALFRAETEQAALVEARKDNGADGWVSENWFQQSANGTT